MAIYAAQIDRVDQNVGRLVARLKQLGIFDNTLILFLADNGGCAEGGIWGFDREKGRLGTADSYSSYGLSWANASNTPFRRYKHWVHEGGTATPLVAHWPAAIRQKGKLVHEPAHVIDLMATCCDVAGATYPRTYQGNEITGPRSHLLGTRGQPRRAPGPVEARLEAPRPLGAVRSRGRPHGAARPGRAAPGDGRRTETPLQSVGRALQRSTVARQETQIELSGLNK